MLNDIRLTSDKVKNKNGHHNTPGELKDKTYLYFNNSFSVKKKERKHMGWEEKEK